MNQKTDTTPKRRIPVIWLLCVLSISGGWSVVSGAEAEPESAKKPTLASRQEMIAARFVRFQKTLLQMAEYMRKTDPDRADLLIRAVGQSNTAGVVSQMKAIVGFLDRNEPVFGDAIDHQQDVIKTFHSLLDLLQSEDRRSELEKETERLQELLKKIGRLIGVEKDIRAATERLEDADRLAKDQDKLEAQAKELIDKIDAHDGKKPSEVNKDKSDKSNEASDESGDKSDAESNPDQDAKNKNDDGKPTEKKDDAESADRDKKEPTEGTPGRAEIDQARRNMNQATQELKQKKHDEASKHQDDAIAKLRDAQEKLEKTLRQLREEERKMFLATMEARFQKMLAMQLLVHHATVQLGKIETEQWMSRHTSQSIQLARDEEAISAEATKALNLLQAEGTSVAFPEAIEQLRDDMTTIVHRLERSKVGKLTQQIEREIIEALEEMIDAFQKEMEESEKPSDQMQPRPGDANEGGLVDALAELRMLRSLQVRINRRTQTIGETITGEQATDSDLVEQLRALAKRQARIQQATYDLAIGRNR